MFPDDLTDEEKARVAVSVAAALNHQRMVAWKRSAATLNTTPPDTTAPTCTITCAQTSPSGAATFNYTITFSESVTGFEVGDFTIAGGTKSNFAGTGAVYTCDVTPTAYEVTADVNAEVCIDAVGNPNTAATQFPMLALVKWYLAGAIPAANCIIAYQPKGASNLAASYVNLANPGTYNAANIGGNDPGFATATGWQFVGVNNDRLTTGWVPPNQVARSGIARISGATVDANNRYVFGCRDAPGTDTWFALLNTNGSTFAQFRNGTGTTYIHSAGITDGVVAISGLNPYKDAVDLGNITAGTYDLGLRPMYVGCVNSNGSVTGYMDGFMQAIAFYDIALSGAQITALTTAMNNLP
jgi:hypothetical protein